MIDLYSKCPEITRFSLGTLMGSEFHARLLVGTRHGDTLGLSDRSTEFGIHSKCRLAATHLGLRYSQGSVRGI